MKKRFLKYIIVGGGNTLIHWLFFFMFYHLNLSQSKSNFIAFVIAVTFSFFVNTKFTFKSQFSHKRYFLYVTFLGVISFFIGFISDLINFQPIFTLIVFSGVSLILGFYYSHYFVFKENND